MVFVVVFALVVVVVSLVVWAIIRVPREDRVEERNSFLLIPVDPTRASLPRPTRAPRPLATAGAPAPAARASPPPATRPDDAVAAAPAAETGDTATVQFRRPVEHAVQLLPGRLEVVAGERRHKEIRLVRVPGERPEVVLGREQVDTPGHVALQSSTVSRRHARLVYADGRWIVANLSQTNPVVVNDEALAIEHERTLADGDRLELGEVVLRFHAR